MKEPYFQPDKTEWKLFGFNAEDVNKYAGFKTNMREYLAKAKAYWDLIFGVEPKFGGDKVLIP